MQLGPDLVYIRGLETLIPFANLDLLVLDRAWKPFLCSYFVHMDALLRCPLWWDFFWDAVGKARWVRGLQRDLDRVAHQKVAIRVV